MSSARRYLRSRPRSRPRVAPERTSVLSLRESTSNEKGLGVVEAFEIPYTLATRERVTRERGRDDGWKSYLVYQVPASPDVRGRTQRETTLRGARVTRQTHSLPPFTVGGMPDRKSSSALGCCVGMIEDERSRDPRRISRVPGNVA